MRTVTLLQPPKIVFGQGCATQCADDMLALGLGRVFIVTSPPIIGLAEPLADALREGGASVTIYAEIATEPAVSTFEAAMAAARAFDPDAVVGLGGGSAIDVAKLIAALYDGKQAVREVFGIGQVASRAPYLATLPTTPRIGPSAVWTLTRCPGTRCESTPPIGAKKRKPFSSIYLTMKPISSQ